MATATKVATMQTRKKDDMGRRYPPHSTTSLASLPLKRLNSLPAPGNSDFKRYCVPLGLVRALLWPADGAPQTERVIFFRAEANCGSIKGPAGSKDSKAAGLDLGLRAGLGRRGLDTWKACWTSVPND